jgi:transposase
MELLVQWRAEIASGQVRVMFLDECHLLWGDVSGYGWSRRNRRVDVAVPSPRQRQTYYGALDYLSKRFYLQAYDAGNSENTVAFLEYLQSLIPEAVRFILIWDGASYHRSAVLKAFLAQVNASRPACEWKITCIRLAPNAPEQNPVEDVWLQAKRFLRQLAHVCKTFKSVKFLFHFFTHLQVFDFPKAFMYGYCSCPI